MTAASVIALLAVPASGAAVDDTSATSYRPVDLTAAAPVCPPNAKPVPNGCIPKGAGRVVHGERCKSARLAVTWFRLKTWERQLVRDGNLATRSPIAHGKTCRWARFAADTWVARARSARRALVRWQRERRNEQRALYEKWRCIHEHEGAWNANTGNGYYGGLQMDVTFQLSHGREFYERWGTADRWPVWAQIAAAEDAYVTRGFAPWPNTSRMCGLR